MLTRLPTHVPTIKTFLMLGLLAGTAFTGLFAGARTRWYRPDSLSATIVAMIGVVCCVLSVLLVFLVDRPASIKSLSPSLKHLENHGIWWIGLFLLAALVFNGAACVLCLVNTPGKYAPDARNLASLAFFSLIASIVSTVLAVVIAVCISMPEDVSTGHRIILVFYAIKFGLWEVGFSLLIPVGLTDLLVSLSPPSSLKE